MPYTHQIYGTQAVLVVRPPDSARFISVAVERQSRATMAAFRVTVAIDGDLDGATVHESADGNPILVRPDPAAPSPRLAVSYNAQDHPTALRVAVLAPRGWFTRWTPDDPAHKRQARLDPSATAFDDPAPSPESREVA